MYACKHVEYETNVNLFSQEDQSPDGRQDRHEDAENSDHSRDEVARSKDDKHAGEPQTQDDVNDNLHVQLLKEKTLLMMDLSGKEGGEEWTDRTK